MARGITAPALTRPPRRAYRPGVQPVDVEKKPVVGMRQLPFSTLDINGWASAVKAGGLSGYQVTQSLDDFIISTGVKPTQLTYRKKRDKGWMLSMVGNLTPELRTWYDEQKALSDTQNKEWKAEYRKILKQLEPDLKWVSQRARLYDENNAVARTYPRDHAKRLRYRQKMLKATKPSPKAVVSGQTITVNVYEIDTQRGPKKFEAVNEEQARRKAEAYGLKVKDVKKVGDTKLTPSQAYERIQTAERRSKVQGGEAAITYGKAFGEEYEVPEDSVPVDLGPIVGMGFLGPEMIEGLKTLPFYEEAKGTEQEKLSRCAQDFHALETIELPNGDKVLKRSVINKAGEIVALGWEDIPEKYRRVAQTAGVDEMYAQMSADAETKGKARTDIETKLDKYKTEEGYNITAALVDKAITPDELNLVGFESSDIMGANDVAKEWGSIEKDFLSLPPDKQGWYIKNLNAMGRYTGLELPEKPYSKLSSEQQKKVLEWYSTNRPEYFKERAIATGRVALGFVPIVGTVYFWKQMSPTWKAISIVTDALCMGFIVNAGAAGARVARGYTAGARVKGAVKGAGQMVLAEITAPAEILAHPVETAKGIGRQIQSTIETFLHPKKIPLGSAELTYTSTRLPVKDVGGATKAMELRDAVVNAAIHGKRTTVTIGDVTLTLTPAELQKLGGALAVHSTPDIRPFMNGAIVKGGAEGSGLFVSPNLHTRFATATAFGDIPEGGIRGALIIRDPAVLRAMAPSGKIYRGAAEIEAILKTGTALPPPSQVLFTRDVIGHRVTLLVFGKPYTPAQIARLKFLGGVDTIGQIFKPTLKISGGQRYAINTMDDMVLLSKDRAALVRQIGAARTAGRVTVTQELGQRLSDIDREISNLVRRINTPGAVIRPGDILWGQYTDMGLLERWRGLSTGRVTTTFRGTRLPDIRTAQAITRARIAREEFRTAPSARYAPYAPYARASIPRYATPAIPRTVTPFPRYAPPTTPRIGPPPVRPRGPAKQVTTPIIPMGGRKRKRRIPAGSITWRQGVFWKYIPPPWRQEKPITLRHPPKGARYTAETTPEKTIQLIGKPKAKVPKSASIDLGVVDIVIGNYGKKITYLGKGLETVAGHSLTSTTKGMSIPAKGSVRVSGYAKLAFGTDLRSLVLETYNKKIPKKFANKVLGQKLGKMSAKEIAMELKETKVSSLRRAEILKMLPDRVRRQVELWESMVNDYAPTRGMPKAKIVPTIFRRKKKKEFVKSASVG